jgi:multidrug efflux pump subunit AcrB
MRASIGIATAMAGIIVRESILIVEFVKIDDARGKRVAGAAVAGAGVAMRMAFVVILAVVLGDCRKLLCQMTPD